MGRANFLQTSFSGGRWSPFNHGRADDPGYRTALAECLNGFPIETKAWTRRPGTQYAASTYLNSQARLIPFSFEDNLPYQFELSNGNMRLFEGTRLILDPAPSASQIITGISTAKPAVVTVGTASSLVTGSTAVIQLSDLAAQAAMPNLNNRQLVVTKLTGVTFSIADAVTGLPIDGNTIGWVSGLNALLSGILVVTQPYVNGDWGDVNYIQNETLMLLLERGYAPQLVEATPPTPSADASFTINPAQFVDGPYLDPIDGITITPDVTSGLVTLTLGAQVYSATTAYAQGDYVLSSSITYVSLQDANEGNTPASSPTFWQATSAGEAIGPGGFQTSDIGRHVRLLSEPPNWVSATTYTTGQVVKFNDLYWTALTGMTGATPSGGSINPNQPGNLTTTWALNPTGGKWTWGKVVSLPTSGIVNPATGTAFGTMTGGGGLASAFDGVTIKTGSASASQGASGGSGIDADVGLHFTSAIAVSSVKLFPSSDLGFGEDVHSHSFSMTFKLRAKTTAPSSPSDGTLLGTFTTSNGATQNAFTITSSDGVTAYNYIWVEITAGTSSSYTIYVAQLQLFGTGAAPAGSLVKVQIMGDPLLYTTTMTIWRLGLFTTTLNPLTNLPTWPTCGCYTEGRLWLAGAVRNRFDASVSNDFLNFAPTGPDGTVADNNAIDYTVNSSDLNAVLWMMPDQEGIVLGTIGGEWLVDGPTTGGFSPTNIRARRMTQFGCANVQPKRTGLTNVFLQRQSQKLIEFLADVYSGRFVGKNLSEFGRDLCKPGILEIAYTQQLDPVVWSRTTAGLLNGLTYHRSSLFSTTPPEIVAWHRHVLGSNRQVQSLIATTTNGTEDAISMVTFDPEFGTYHVEVATPLFDEGASIMDAWFLDDAVVPAAGATTTINSVTGIQFSGLSHLESKLVTAWVAGLDCGDYQVLNGSIFVPFGATNGLFTSRSIHQIASTQPAGFTYGCNLDGGLLNIPAVVGFTYTSKGKLLRTLAPDAAGSQLGPALAKKRRQANVGLLLVDTQGVSLGVDDYPVKAAKFITKGGTAIAISQLFSGIYWGTVDDSYSYDSQLTWEITRPYPATVAAAGPFFETEN